MWMKLHSLFQASSPVCTELEMNVMDWLAKMLGLPDHFLHHHPSSQGRRNPQRLVDANEVVPDKGANKCAGFLAFLLKALVSRVNRRMDMRMVRFCRST